jgi:class 3 adenylate cyclase
MTADGVQIAYQVVGNAPVDLVFVPWLYSHVEMQWEDPDVSHYRNRLASFARLILLDQRGSGLSDPVALKDLPSLELYMEDLRAVVDAVGSERPVIVGHMDGALIAMLFAATYPDRVSGLVLLDAYARYTSDDGYEGVPREIGLAGTEWFSDLWGTGGALPFMAQSRNGDADFQERLARMERLSMSPGATKAVQLMINGDLDVRAVLPTISTPTLIVQRAFQHLQPAFGSYLLDHIPNARFVELPGMDWLYWSDNPNAVLDEIEEFVTGARHAPDNERVLATVMFTDIVNSTVRAQELGDQKWRELRGLHDDGVRRQLARFRGNEIKHTGDGFLATFDGPARAVRCACAIRDTLRGVGLEIRAGVHTGEIELIGDDIGGIGVHIGQRIQSLAAPNEVLVSSTVKDLVVGSGIEFGDRGAHTLKGVADQWRLYIVDD